MRKFITLSHNAKMINVKRDKICLLSHYMKRIVALVPFLTDIYDNQ